MSRKDFELIARTIRDLDIHVERGRIMKEHIGNQFADALQSTNPRFDRARFIEACLK